MPMPDNSVVLYDFFKLLKKINENTLKHEELSKLLSEIDDSSNHSHNKFFVTDQASYIKAMDLVKKLSSYCQSEMQPYEEIRYFSISSVPNEKYIILSKISSELKILDLINQENQRFSSFQAIDITKLAALVENYNRFYDEQPLVASKERQLSQESATTLIPMILSTWEQMEKISAPGDPSPIEIKQLKVLIISLDENRLRQGDNIYSMIFLNKAYNLIRRELELINTVQFDLSPNYYQYHHALRTFYVEQSISFNNQRIIYQTKATLLEKTLAAFVSRIEEIYAISSFPSTELITTLREKIPNLYNNGKLNQENTTQLLTELQAIIKQQLSTMHSNTASIQFFYETSLSVLASLDQTPHSNSIAISSEEKFFSDMIITFNNIKNHINLSKWNTRGQGFFSKKTPDGIIKLRKLFAELPTMQNAESTNEIKTNDKINTIKKFMALYELTEKKVLSKGYFRTDSVHSLYKKISAALDSAYNKLNPEAKSKFYLAYIYSDEPSHGAIFSGISHNTPNAVTNLFNKAPTLPEDFVECCKKPQLTTDSGVSPKPNA